MTLRGLIEAVEIGNEAAAKLNARKAYPEHAPDMGRAYNGSLDAAKRLHDALLPGWDWSLFVESAEVSKPFVCDGVTYSHVYYHEDVNAARAWLICILRALEQEGRDGHV